MNFYPKHVGDFIKDTVGLTLAEVGAYNRLLDQYYAHEHPIIHGDRYRITGAVEQKDKEAVDYVLGKFFVQEIGTVMAWRNKRADQEIDLYREKSEKAAASAKHRWSERNANAMRTHSEGNANQYPVTSNQEPKTTKTKSTPARKRSLPPDFQISERVKSWAAEKGHGSLQAHFEHFVGSAKARGYQYADWDEAFMTAIRADWAKVGQRPQSSGMQASHLPAKPVPVAPHTEMPAHVAEQLSSFLKKVRVA